VSRGTRDPQPLSSLFVYGSITPYGSAFQHDSTKIRKLMSGPTTPGAPKRSGFRLFPFRSPLLRKSRFLSLPSGTEMVHFPEFASAPYGFGNRWPAFQRTGFPHSDTPGSSVACTFPRLFAACRVLHRLPAPRHPPFTLSSLT
jgi:hypothetical protein